MVKTAISALTYGNKILEPLHWVSPTSQTCYSLNKCAAVYLAET